MIVTGIILLAVGVADIARQFMRGRALRITFAVAALLIFVLGGLSAAPLAGLLAVAVAAGWMWAFPSAGKPRAGFWPAVALVIVCVVFVLVLGPRAEAGVLGDVWDIPTPWGPFPWDQSVLVAGAICILLESGNVIVRAALSSEMPDSQIAISPVAVPERAHAQDSAVTGESAGPIATSDPTTNLKGGRLIGPLERIIVFALTLTGVYSLLAAVLAAKGIVRFPEISRDGDSGNRAEYFLIGSLVSWVVALAAAFLVWWGLADVI